MSEGKSPPPSGGADRKNALDTWLGAWPMPEKKAERWEELALEVEKRVASGKPAKSLVNVSDEALVAPPLAELPGEVQSSAAPESGREGQVKMGTSSERQRDRKSFQDLAKLAATTPHPSASWPKASDAPSARKEDDSGIVDLKALAPSDPAVEARARTTPLATVGLFEDDASGPDVNAAAALAVSARSPLAEPSTSEATALPGARPSTPASQPRPKVQKKKSAAGAWAFAATAVVFAAAAASGLVYVRARAHRASTVAVAVAAKTPQAALPPAAQPVTQGATGQASDTKPLDPSQLPLADNRPVAPSAPALLAPSTKFRDQAQRGADAPPPAPPPPPADSQVAEKAPAKPAPANGDESLVDQIRQAAGVTANSEPAATSNMYPEVPSGSVPFKPALGAVQGAVGGVLPGARACLGPDDPVAHATVTFRSDGSAQSVGVSGARDGKDGCIRAALLRARVPPFAQPTFTTSVTVRPN